MNQNSIIEIGSKADVIIRFKSATNINGRAYKPNEPYLFLKRCGVFGSTIQTKIKPAQQILM